VSPTVLLTALGIVFARILDVSLGTLRTVFIVQGRRGVAATLGFFEVLIWVVVVSGVIRNLDQPAYVIAYPLGFALGTWLGMVLESRLGGSQQVIRIFTRRAAELASRLRELGHVCTEFEGSGREGPIGLVFLQTTKRRADRVIAEAVAIDPQSFVLVDDVRVTSGARIRVDGLARWRPDWVRK